MPVYIVNADPTFPFTRLLRQYGLDLYEEWRTLPAAIDYCGPIDAAEEAHRRQLWGYWPRTLNGNKALIRSHLDEILLAAKTNKESAVADNARTENYVWLALTPESWLKQIDGTGAAGPIERGLLADFKSRLGAANEAAEARPVGQPLARIDNLIRVVAVPVAIDPDTETHAAAMRLVEDELVDSIVFIVHDQNIQTQREQLTLAALRLVAAALDDGAVFYKFRPVGQRGIPTARIYINRGFLQLTEGDRRVDFLKQVLFKADDAAGEGGATGTLAKQVDELREQIEQDFTLAGGERAPSRRTRASQLVDRLEANVPEQPCRSRDKSAAYEPRWVAVPTAAEVIQQSSVEYKDLLAAHLQQVESDWFDSSKITARQWSQDDATVISSIRGLSSGTSGTRETDLADLERARRAVAKTIGDVALAQRNVRAKLHPPAKGSDEEWADPLFKPVVVRSTVDRRSETAVTGPTREYGRTAQGVLEAERSRFSARPAALAILLFGFVFTITATLAVTAPPGAHSPREILRALSLDPTTPTGFLVLCSLGLLAGTLVTAFYRKIGPLVPAVLALSFAVTLGVTAWQLFAQLRNDATIAEALRNIGWHPLGPFLLFLLIGFILSMIMGAAAARHRFASWRVSFEKTADRLKQEALARWKSAKTYGAIHFAAGWLRVLDARIEQLHLELSRTDAAQKLHGEIKSWEGSGATGSLSKEDQESAARLAQELIGTQELAGSPRAHWVVSAARAFPALGRTQLNVMITGLPDPIPVQTSVFLRSAPSLSFDVRKH
jgi:hypothetical protein